MMVQELEFLEKVKLDQKVALVETYIYLFQSKIMKFLKEQKKIYITNYLFLLQTQHLVLLLKFLRLTEENPKLKFLQEPSTVSNLGLKVRECPF